MRCLQSWLLWKLHDGAIVEARSPQLLSLLRSANPGEDAPAVMELYDAIKSLKLAQNDPRIRGLIADFSALHAPSDSGGAPLGLAQIEELTQAIVCGPARPQRTHWSLTPRLCSTSSSR